MEQFLLIPHANLSEVLRLAREAREANDRAREANTQLEQAMEIALAHAGTVNFPQPIAASASDQGTVANSETPQGSVTQHRATVHSTAAPRYKYHVKRGGSGPTYADAVAAELEAEIFTLEEAWLSILPFLQPPYPDDWRHSLRRSLLRDKEQRFFHLSGELYGRDDTRKMATKQRAEAKEGGENLFEEDGEE